MKNKKNTVKSPEEVTKLMEILWLNHKAGNKAPKNNVFWVEFSPLSEEEKASIRAKKEAELKEAKDKDDKPEDLYGVWI